MANANNWFWIQSGNERWKQLLLLQVKLSTKSKSAPGVAFSNNPDPTTCKTQVIEGFYKMLHLQLWTMEWRWSGSAWSTAGGNFRTNLS